MRTFAKVALAVLLVGTAGCYAEAEPVTVTSAEIGYEPAYYDGYVVYYDDYGHPFYYGSGGAVVWVEPSSPYYVGLVNHYHVYGPRYRSWAAHDGYRYRSYRASPGYHYYRGYRQAAPPARYPAHPSVRRR